MGQFAAYLKNLIKKHNISKADLARQLGLKRQNYIGNILRGIHTPTPSRTGQISRILQCTKAESKKLITLALSERRPKKVKPLLPRLRQLLLMYYSENYGSSYASLEKVRTLFSMYPFHFLEHKLLEEIHDYLIENGLIADIPSMEPIIYLSSFSIKDLEPALNKAGFDWAYNTTKNYAIVTFKNPGQAGIKSKRLNLEWIEISKSFESKHENKML